jgi:hypothetical protein
MYYFPQQPPYLLLAIGFFAAFTSGVAFTGTLKEITQKWRKSGAENGESSLSAKGTILPFLGITIGISLFLVSGLAIFGFPNILACAIGLPVSLLTCALVWFQLKSMLTFAERRGMQSLDLDSMR